MLKRLHEKSERQKVTIDFEGVQINVLVGETVAAAVLAAETDYTRTSAISGVHRAPYCQMGICFECLMEIDGVPNRQACMIEVREGMKVSRQYGAREMNDEV
ncbi:MAG: (2Fe-2S)-binding protein [Deltaproteobacteria bacterium]|nr:MAG: (2Fe-2S)-binding protein [Deltaproteobacteria bacterium]